MAGDDDAGKFYIIHRFPCLPLRCDVLVAKIPPQAGPLYAKQLQLLLEDL